MEEYLKKVLEQVRCKKAQGEIREELRAHIEDQKEANLAAGMSVEEAEREAVADMGDPVETGIALDKVHRPQVAWQMIAMMAVMTVASFLVHRQLGNLGTCRHLVIGFVLMMGVYFLDYTRIAWVAKPFAVLFFLFCAFETVFGCPNVGGTIWTAAPLFGIYFGMFPVMMLYVPLYGAVLYQYYGTGYKGLCKSILWALPPLFFAMEVPSIILAAILYVSMGSLLLLAVGKGWFRVAKRDTFYLLGLVGVLIPAGLGAILWLTGRMAPYQMERIRSFWYRQDEEWNYVARMVKQLLSGSSFVGASATEIEKMLPDYGNSWILTYLTASYGQIVFLLVCAGFVFLLYKIFSAVLGQKNQLGMMMGFGCGMVLLLNVLINVLENLGILPETQTFLPFFSQGGGSILLCYILMGMIMSVYRYKDIYSCHRGKAYHGKRLRIRIEMTE